MRPDVCIYHANCTDGFGAAYAVWKRFGDEVIYLPAQYGDPLPEVAGKHVVIVDFSYKRPTLEALARDAHSILILDHHKTAQEDLAGFPVPPGWEDWWLNCRGIGALFDMGRSGARITWDYFHPGTPLPNLLWHIEDRDLWRFSHTDTRAIVEAVRSYDADFYGWANIIRWSEADRGARLAAEGNAIVRRQQLDIAALLGGRRTMRLGGHEVPVANVPGFLASDAGHAMNEGVLFSATYFDAADKRVFSLRSRGDFDVSAIAKQYGGGGHKNAAGFQRPLGWEGDGIAEVHGSVSDSEA